MDANECWLLHSVVDQKHSLSLLTMENVEALFDRPNHGMDRTALSEVLARLFEKGLLIASNDERGEFAPNADELAAALDGALDADYGLTATGGAAWEEVSKPDWNRYVDGIFGADSEDEFDSLRRERGGEFCCADRGYLQKFMDSLIFRGIAPHKPSYKWDEIQPWQALYWKQLPSAHRVRFVGVGAPVWPEEKIPEEFRGLGVWYMEQK